MAQGIEVGTAYLSLAVSGSRLGRDIDDAVQSAGRRAGNSGGSIGSKLAAGMGKALKVGAIATGGAVAGVLGTALVKGFSRLSAIDAAKKKLAGLGNSAKDIDKIMQNATASVKGTAFGLDEAATTAAGAVAAGIKPGKQLQGVLNTVADTATIAGSSMSDMGTIFGSVAARGKLQGDDLMQLQSRGVPVLAFLAKHYKTTAKEASVMVSKGQVDFKNFNAAMQENLGGAAKKSGDTVQGAFANLKASLGRIGAGLLGGVFPKIAPTLQNITKMMGPLEKIAGQVGEKIGGVLAGGFDLVGKAIGKIDWKRVGDTIGDVIGKAKQIIDILFKGDFTHGPFQEDSPVVNFFFNLRDAIANTLPKISGAAKNIGSAVSNAFKNIDWGKVLSVVQSIGLGIAGTFQKLLPHLKDFASGMGKVAQDVMPLVKSVGSFLVEAFKNALPYLKMAGIILGVAFVAALKVIPPVLHTVITAVTGLFNIVKPILPIIAGAAAGFVAFKVATMAWSAATKVAGAISRAFAIAQGILNAVMSANPIMLVVIAIAALAAGLVLAYKKSDTFRAIVNAAFGAVKTVVMGVVDWFKNSFVPFFTTTIPNTFQGVVDWVKQHWKLITAIITGPIGAAVILIATHWDTIKAKFTAVKDWVVGAFSKAWGAVKSTITTPIGAAKDFIVTRWENIKANFTAAKDWVLGAFSKAWNAVKNTLTGPVTGARDFINTRWNNIKANFTAAKDWVLGAFSKSWSAVKGVLLAPVKGAKLLIDTEISGLKKIFSGVRDAIGRIWSSLPDKITGPINSVLTWVGKHFVGPLNSLLSKVGLGKNFLPWLSAGGPVGHGGGHALPPGFAAGGVIRGPWAGPTADNVLGLSAAGVPTARVNPGEFITKVASTRSMESRFPGALEFINRTGRLPGFAMGGKLGGALSWGAGLVGDIAGDIWSGVKKVGGFAVDMAKLAAHPLDTIKALASHLLSGISGNMWGQAAKGALSKTVGGIADKVKSVFGGGVPGGAGGKGGRGWQWQWNLIHSMFPGVSLTSAYRPGSIVAGSGALSYHALGRAIDLGGSVSQLSKVANWILKNYGSSTHDLLYSPLWGNMGIFNGRWYPQPAVTVRNHGNHVHWGYASGGQVAPYRPPVFDRGGTLAPGLNMVDNRTGRPEPLVRADQQGGMVVNGDIHLHDLETVRNVEDLMARIGVAQLQMGGV